MSAEVDGLPVWFESPDVALAPAPEAFASTFLIPALLDRSRLVVADPLDATWRANAHAIAALLRGWWRTPALELDAGPAAARAVATGGDATALFFSAGADSFHQLLHGGRPVDRLVTLHGFDFPLEDAARAAAVDASVRAVAAALGLSATIVRTNAREHPRIAGAKWEHVYGGVLGGVAQLLAPHARRAIVASSAPGDLEIPWGSHWRLDPLWSSHAIEVIHGGRGVGRLDKLRAIAADPLVLEHLRVCWRNLTPTGNCSRCAKCTLTRLLLADQGVLARSPRFEGPESLADALDGVRKTPDRIREFEQLSASPRIAPEVAAAARRLVRRSRHRLRPDVRARRAILGWLLARFGAGGRTRSRRD